MKRFARFLALLAGLVLPAAAKTIYVSEDGPADDYSYDEEKRRWYYWEEYWHDDGYGSGWMDSRQVYINGEPGDSWENAYSSIDDACDAAESGDTVLVGPGTYAPFWTSYKGLTIRSVAGAERTVVDAKHDYSDCAGLGATDRIVGFTLQNAYESGVSCYLGGYVDACIIRNCGSVDNVLSEYFDADVVVRQYRDGGARDAILTDCVIENCLGGGAAWCTLHRCIVRNCRGNEFGGLNECIAYNTLIVGNRAEVMDAADPNEGRCGGAAHSTLYNCTIVDNYAQRELGGVGGSCWGAAYGSTYDRMTLGDRTASSYGPCKVYNSIVVNNTCGNGTVSNYGMVDWGGGDYWYGGWDGEGFAYSCSYPKPPLGTGNTGTAPRFADSDYRLAAGSPGIDAGNNSYVYETEDLDGFQRIYGSRVDLGAYEYVGRKTCVVSFDPNGGSVSLDSIQVAVGSVLGNLPIPFRYGWTFEGWFDSPNEGSLVTAQTKAAGRNMYLYAHWSAETDSVWQPVYRFYSKNYKGHFYTINPEERATLMCTNPNWKYEGVAYYAATEQVQGTVPLHRFYSKNYRGHFYTIDEGEMWTIRNTNPNWRYESVAFYVYPNRTADATRSCTAIYRFWSKGYRHHFFTIDEDEMWTIRYTNPNWKYEGEAFYAYEDAP